MGEMMTTMMMTMMKIAILNSSHKRMISNPRHKSKRIIRIVQSIKENLYLIYLIVKKDKFKK
jgi:hypothetical protein